MNKNEFIDAVAAKAGLYKKDAKVDGKRKCKDCEYFG